MGFLSGPSRLESDHADNIAAATSVRSFLSQPLLYLRQHKLAGFGFAGAFAFAGLLTGVGVTAAEGSQFGPVLDHSHGSVQLNVSSTANTPTPTQSSTTLTSPSSSSSSSVHSTVSTDVTVNGQSVDVPANGSVHKTVTNSDGSKTNVNVSSTSQANGSSSSGGNLYYSLDVSTNSTTDSYSSQDSSP